MLECNLYFTLLSLCLTLLSFSLLSCPTINGVFWRYLKYSKCREIIISVFMLRIKVLRTTCIKLTDAFDTFERIYLEPHWKNNCLDCKLWKRRLYGAFLRSCKQYFDMQRTNRFCKGTTFENCIELYWKDIWWPLGNRVMIGSGSNRTALF